MFEEQILLGPEKRSIRVDTHRGNPVRNEIAPNPGEAGTRRYGLLRKRYGSQWKNRKSACGVYNCFGMLFASRRTAIYDDDQVELILRDDGYRRVSAGEAVPGDIVLYRIASSGELRHGALVLRSDRLVGSSSAPVHFVLSKWNDSMGEDEHNVRSVAWDDVDSIEFWTDRQL